MNITVFGASGGIGAHLVVLATDRGHRVRAVYRTPPPEPLPAEAEILVSPDIFDPDFAADLEEIIKSRKPREISSWE